MNTGIEQPSNQSATSVAPSSHPGVPGVTLHLHARVTTAIDPTRRVCEVAAMFGLGVDDQRTIDIVPPAELAIAPHRVIFITGASGGGKTTLLRLIAEALKAHPQVRVIDFAQLDAPQSSASPDAGAGASSPAIIDTLGETLEHATHCLALAGLNDAFVMLRRVDELSDGQRYRYRLARAISAVAACGPASSERASLPGAFAVVLADEFGATLDRLTAQVIARNVRKWVRRADVCFIAATTHDDLLESLDPDVLIVQHPGEGMQMVSR